MRGSVWYDSTRCQAVEDARELAKHKMRLEKINERKQSDMRKKRYEFDLYSPITRHQVGGQAWQRPSRKHFLQPISDLAAGPTDPTLIESGKAVRRCCVNTDTRLGQVRDLGAQIQICQAKIPNLP
jgi:hypothetical protein